MRPADAHLTPQEFELLLFEAADSNHSNVTGASVSEAQQHLSGCAICQSVSERYRSAEEALRSLESGNKASVNKNRGNEPLRRSDCPVDETWLTLAAGLMKEDEASHYVTHAASCDWCGSLLKESMEDLAQDVTPEEQETLTKLPTASLTWQREMGRKLTAQVRNSDMQALAKKVTPMLGKGFEVREKSPASSKNKGTFRRWPQLAWAVACLVVVGAAVWLTRLKARDPNVSQLLAQAYMEQRTIELRIPNAGFTQMRVARGSSRSSFSKPASLLAAKPIIKRRLEADPDNPQWLQAEGWAELLEGEYNPAIQSFKRALEKNPASAELMRDAATAYFERGESEGRDNDYRNAAELLDKSLTAKPDEPIALFNRAIVYEHLLFYNNAIADWKHYLLIDSNSDWAADASRRLDELKKKLKEHEQSSYQPLSSAQAFGRDISFDRPELWAAVDRRIDAYLDQAITTWLPQAFPTSPRGTNESNTAVHALRILAQVLAKQHGDQWLDDFLAVSHSQWSTLAVRELATAVKANLAGDAKQARETALRAEKFFRLAGNGPGVARSRLEQVHALQRAQKGYLCWVASKELSASPAMHKFKWILVQLLMEQASCRGKENDFESAVRLADQALASAQQSGFIELQLRALAIAADIELSRGRAERAWKYDSQGLDLYWHCQCAPLRGYAFYDNLEYIAEDSGQWNLARGAGIEAVTAIAATPNRSGEAMARFRLASTNRMLSRNEEAREEFERARVLFSIREKTGANHDYMLFSQLFLADLQVRQGEVDAPLRLLLQLEPQLRDVSNYLIPLQLYRALATAYLKKNQYKEAESAAAKAVRIAEDGLRSIRNHSERLVWRKQTSNAYRVFLESYLLNRHDSESALNFWEWYHATPLREPRGRTPEKLQTRWTFDLNDPTTASRSNITLRNVLANMWLTGQGFVVYAQVPDGIIIWSLGDHGAESRWVPIELNDLAVHVQRFVSYCSDPDSDIGKLKEEGRYLYGLLIAPIEKLIRDKSVLLIELDGVISRLPVEVLVDPVGHYLGETHAINISLGMAFLKSGKYKLSGTDKTLVVNPPSTAGEELDLPPLADAAREAEDVASRFVNSTHLEGPQATVPAVRTMFPNIIIFHFAGHAIIFGRGSGLLFAREEGINSSRPSVWDAEQIRQSDLRNVKLVVLSSCTTEETESRVEDDPDSVVGAFLRAGVDRVVASRWNVDSKFTRDYMRWFYSRLESSNSSSDLLKAVSEDARRNSYIHPYYWAGFTLFGGMTSRV